MKSLYLKFAAVDRICAGRLPKCAQIIWLVGTLIMHKIIAPQGMTFPSFLSPGALVGNTLYVAGMCSVDANVNVIGIGDIKVQTRQVIEYIKAVVEEAGGALQDVVFNSIFLRNLDDFEEMNKIYIEYFAPNPPPRYCIRAELVAPDGLVEICSIAHLTSKV